MQICNARADNVIRPTIKDDYLSWYSHFSVYLWHWHEEPISSPKPNGFNSIEIRTWGTLAPLSAVTIIVITSVIRSNAPGLIDPRVDYYYNQIDDPIMASVTPHIPRRHRLSSAKLIVMTHEMCVYNNSPHFI
jgi:hypothetical protein